MKRSPKIKSLLDQINSGKMEKASTKILDVIIRQQPVTIRNIIFWTGIKESTVVARLSDLEDLGVIYKSGTTKEGNLSLWRYEKEFDKQTENAKKRANRKFQQWANRGLTMHRNSMTPNLIAELEKPSLWQQEDIVRFKRTKMILSTRCSVQGCMVGSSACKNCKYFIAIDNIDSRVKCFVADRVKAKS